MMLPTNLSAFLSSAEFTSAVSVNKADKPLPKARFLVAFAMYSNYAFFVKISFAKFK